MKKNINLKMALFTEGITQNELANQTGIPRSYISQAIHGRYILDDIQKLQICEILGVDIESEKNNIFHISQKLL